MKILCLIIDSEGPWRQTYAAHRQLWNAVLDRNPDVEGYFLRSDPSLASDYAVTSRVFATRGEERYDTILAKTLKAIEVLLGDHDYVLRTNLSSLYDFPLLRRLHLATEDVYAGSLQEALGCTYVSGSGMILSQDVARKLVVSAPALPQVNCWDDIAIGQILAHLNIPPTRIDRYNYNYSGGDDQVEIGRYVQYRLRDEGDPQRAREPRAAEYLFSKVYPT